MTDTTAAPRDPAMLETKAGRPAAPAVHTNDDVKALASAIDRQTAQLERQIKATGATGRSFADRRAARERKFTELREAVDRRLADVRRKGAADPITEDKVRRVNRAISADDDQEKRELRSKVIELERKAARSGISRPASGPGFSAKSAAFARYRKGVDQYLRHGIEMVDGMHLKQAMQMALKAMTTEIAPDGGYLVHPEHDTGPVERILTQIVPMRQIATVRTINAASFKTPMSKGGGAAEWVDERSDRTDTATPALVEQEYPAFELHAQPKASSTLLEDAAIDIESFIADEVAINFGEAEALAFISGNGVKKPKGLLAYDWTAASSWTAASHWGRTRFVASGVDGAIGPAVGAQVNQGDKLMAVIYSLKQIYRQDASWLMNRGTIQACRTLKDGNGSWIWQTSAKEGEPDKLLGYASTEAEQMPDIATGAYPIGFGNWKRGYLIVDRVGMQVLRDRYTAYPYIVFKTRKRVGGGVRDFDAMTFLKSSAS